MYAINILSSLHRSFSKKLSTAVTSLKHIRLNSTSSKISSYNVQSKVDKDVVLFELNNLRFFLALNAGSLIHCACWTHAGVFLLQSLRNTDPKAQQLWERALEKDMKYSRIITAFSVFFGWSVLAATTFYSFRSIRKITLHKGGNYLTLVTYGLPGYNTIKLPINQVSCLQHRLKAKKYIPLKLKNKLFYYLIDLKGEFLNPTVFDFTAGIKRGFV